MNKAQLVAAMAESMDVTKAEAERTLGAVTDAVSEALRAGEEVNISGFGKFSVKDRAARVGRNPQTGEAIDIKASKSASWKVAKALKDTL